jgi:hypothetical protein
MKMKETDKQIDEVKNIRYIEIISCKNCGHSGHTSGSEGITYICSNPDHLNLDIKKKFIGKTAYPIVLKEQKDNAVFVPIPSWCTLPKKLDMSG